MATRNRIATGAIKEQFEGRVRKWKKQWVPCNGKPLRLLRWVQTEEKTTDLTGPPGHGMQPVDDLFTAYQLQGSSNAMQHPKRVYEQYKQEALAARPTAMDVDRPGIRPLANPPGQARPPALQQYQHVAQAVATPAAAPPLSAAAATPAAGPMVPASAVPAAPSLPQQQHAAAGAPQQQPRQHPQQAPLQQLPQGGAVTAQSSGLLPAVQQPQVHPQQQQQQQSAQKQQQQQPPGSSSHGGGADPAAPELPEPSEDMPMV